MLFAWDEPNSELMLPVIFFSPCRQSRIYGRLDEWSELESKQLSCGVKASMLGELGAKTWEFEPLPWLLQKAVNIFQHLENTPFLAPGQHPS